MAVGSTTTPIAAAPLVESWNGSAWKVAKVASPLSAKQKGNVGLYGVSCASATSCVAVGYYTVGTNPIAPQHPFSEVKHNGAWVIHKTAVLSGVSGATLVAVSCVAAQHCIAVGDYATNTGGAGALSEAWNGTAWTLVKTPALASINSEFLGVSCPSSTRCTAVGYEDKGDTQIALAERLRGLTWHVESTPRQSGVVTLLDSVSCPTSTDCTAVGGSFPSSSKEVTLAESWNGSTWKVTPTPALGGKGISELNGVSCTSVNVCRAVGLPPATGQASAGLAEAWNGSSWKVQTVADPSPTTSLAAVSCTRGPHCTAAGAENPTPTKTHPLAERN